MLKVLPVAQDYAIHSQEPPETLARFLDAVRVVVQENGAAASH